jgi:hypothetical protein
MSFAAPLKDMVIEADPLVDMGCVGCIARARVHLSDLLDSGKTFEECKREYQEVRRSLQRIGQGIRKIDPDYWVRNLLERMAYVREVTGAPIVVTDVRYENEADALRRDGFYLVRIVRKADASGFTMEQTRAMLHESETALDSYPADVTIRNDGDVIDLHTAVLDLV